MTAPRTTAHFADLAGRRRKFQLRIGEIEELEAHCRAGIGEIAMRLGTGTYRYSDIRETIRLGMIGGGASEAESTAIAMRYVDDVPIDAHLELAARIISALNTGNGDPGEAEAVKHDEPATSPPSLPPEPPPGSPPGDVRAMTLADFNAAMSGWIAAHRSVAAEAPSDEEALAALAEEIAAGRA